MYIIMSTGGVFQLSNDLLPDPDPEVKEYKGNAPMPDKYDFDSQGETGPWNSDPECKGYK